LRPEVFRAVFQDRNDSDPGERTCNARHAQDFGRAARAGFGGLPTIKRK
jgi:hypothetical protein